MASSQKRSIHLLVPRLPFTLCHQPGHREPECHSESDQSGQWAFVHQGLQAKWEVDIDVVQGGNASRRWVLIPSVMERDESADQIRP